MPASLTTPIVEFDHHSKAFADTYIETANAIREVAPVVWTNAHGGYWIVTRHEECAEAFRDSESFTTRYGASIPKLSFGSKHIPITMDPPEHGIYRRFLNPWFTKKAITTREPEIREAARALVTSLRERGEWDFVTDMADVLPGYFTLSVLGFPTERRVELLKAMERGMRNQGTSDEALRAQMLEDNEWLRSEIQKEIEDRRIAPRDDLMTHLVSGELETGEHLTDQQIHDVVMVLLLAGFHTTSGALQSFIMINQRDPQLRAYLRSNPDKIPAAIEETIRLYAGSTGQSRTVDVDIEFAGEKMSKGDMIFFSLASVGRDPRFFEDPEVVDLDRDHGKSQAFGWGVHRCLGMHLARIILKVEIETILEIIPDYEIDMENVRMSHSMGIAYLHDYIPARLPA